MRLKSSIGSAAWAAWPASAILLLAGSIAMAQYSFDMSDIGEGDHIRYFGSAKDVNGKLVSGATILLAAAGYPSFVFVTDELGRFRGSLPLDAVADSVVATCSKSGFTFVRVTKRPGPEGVEPTVQVDCILDPTAT